jgi:vitamin B12 transporter
MKKSVPLTGAAFACLFPLPSLALEQPAVLVTATRTAETADDTLAPVILINREDIERMQASDVADLLRFHAGIDLGRNGGPGQPTSIFMRGTDSNHTLVMVDGVRINPGTLGIPSVQNIDPAMIDHIEIVKGPRSSLYGSDAVGGVINVITRRAEPGTEVSASAAGGTDDTQRYAASLRHAAGNYRFGLDAARQSTDGFPPLEGSDVDRGFENTSVNARLGGRLGGVDAELSHYQARGNTEYLDFFQTPLDQDFLDSVTAFRLEADPLASWASRLLLSRARDDIDQSQDDDFVHSRRNTVDWQNDVQLGSAQLLTAGVTYSREKDSSLSFGTAYDDEIEVREGYLQDAIEHGAHRLVVSARHTDHDAFGDHTTWNAAYGFQLTPATRLTLAAGTAFRAPDATDRFGFGGNPDLDPERARNVEAGLRHRLSDGQRVSLQVFRTDITDLIEFDFGSSTLINVDEAKIRGVEAGYEYSRDRLRASVEAVALDAENATIDSPLPRRARRSLTASLAWTEARYQLGADFLAAGRRKDSDFTDVYMGGYGLLDLTAAWRLARDWTLRARVENALDKDYELADGYQTAGRAYLLQVAWQHRSGGGSR